MTINGISGFFNNSRSSLIKPRNDAQRYTNGEVDLKKYYTPDEINKLIKRFPALTPQFGGMKFGANDIDVIYNTMSGTVVLNNKRATNCTVEIDNSGHAISVGSWHRTDYDGDYSDIINDVKTRVNK